MRVAALYDVHGNLPALEAVLGEVDREGVDAIVCGGDTCAGPMPRAALELLQEGFPLPWASVTYHFGQRKGSHR